MTTRDDLLETLRRLAAEHGPDITLYRFRAETGISRNVVYDRWGNWTNLRVAAGLPRRVTIGPVYSQDELLGEFHAAAKEIDRYPTMSEFARLSPRCWNTLDRRFGPKSTVIDQYRVWLDHQPADTRPTFLVGIEKDCEPTSVPGVGVLNKVVEPLFALESLIADIPPAMEPEERSIPPGVLRKMLQSVQPIMIILFAIALAMMCENTHTSRAHFAKQDRHAEGFFEERTRLPQGELFEGQVVDLWERDDQPAAFTSDPQFVQSLMMSRVEGVGDSQKRGHFRHSDAFIAIERRIRRMRGLRRRPPMIPGGERDQGHIAAGQSEQFAVLNQVHCVFVITARAHVQANLMQNRGDTQQQFIPRFESMILPQILKEDFAEFRHMFRMRLIELESSTQIDGGASHLVRKVFRERPAGRHFGQQPIAQIHICDDQMRQLKRPAQLHVSEECRSQRGRILEGYVVTMDELVFVQVEHGFRELLELGEREPCDSFRFPIGNQEFGSEADITAERDQFVRRFSRNLRENLFDNPIDVRLHDSPRGGVRGMVRVQRLPQPQRTETVGMREEHVGSLHEQEFRTAAADLGHDGAFLVQLRIGPQPGLHAEVRDPVDFGFINRCDRDACRGIDAVQKRQSILSFTHGTGRHAAELLRAFDLVLLQDALIAPQHANRFFDGRFFDDAAGEGIFAETDGLRQRGPRADLSILPDFGEGHANGSGTDIDHRDRHGCGGMTIRRSQQFHGHLRCTIKIKTFSNHALQGSALHQLGGFRRSADHLPGPRGTPHHTGVIPELGDAQIPRLGKCRHCPFSELFGDLFNEQFGHGFDETAAEDNDVGEQKIHDTGHRQAEMPGSFAQNLFDDLVTRGDGFGEHAAANVGEVRSCDAQQMRGLSAISGFRHFRGECQSAGDSFQTPAATTPAWRSIGHDGHVPEFQARGFAAAENAAFVDQSRANARAGKHSQRGPCPGGGSEAIFAEHTGIDIVADRDFAAVFLREKFFQRNIFPPEIGGFDDQAGLHVNRARDPDTDPRQLAACLPALFEQFVDRRTDALDTGFGTFVPTGLLLASGDDLETAIEEHGVHLRASQIEADPVLFRSLRRHGRSSR